MILYGHYGLMTPVLLMINVMLLKTNYIQQNHVIVPLSAFGTINAHVIKVLVLAG